MTATRQVARWDPDTLAQLEHERDVLLRELRELDGQLDAGELRHDQHAALRDEMTARTADVLALIARGRAVQPAAPRRRPWAVAAIGAALAVAAVLVGWLL